MYKYNSKFQATFGGRPGVNYMQMYLNTNTFNFMNTDYKTKYFFF